MPYCSATHAAPLARRAKDLHRASGSAPRGVAPSPATTPAAVPAPHPRPPCHHGRERGTEPPRHHTYHQTPHSRSQWPSGLRTAPTVTPHAAAWLVRGHHIRSAPAAGTPPCPRSHRIRSSPARSVAHPSPPTWRPSAPTSTSRGWSQWPRLQGEEGEREKGRKLW